MSNVNPYKRMYLVSEHEYMTGSKQQQQHPEQQARLNAIALQDEKNVRYADKLDYDEDDGHLIVAATSQNKQLAAANIEGTGDESNKLTARQIKFHDEKYMRVAKDVSKEETEEDEDQKLKWTNIPLDTFRWDVLPPNIRTRAHLLITLVHRYAKVNSQQKFQHHTKAVSGSNVFDLVRWAVISTRGRTAKAPFG
jgi:hypothetical protein